MDFKTKGETMIHCFPPQPVVLNKGHYCTPLLLPPPSTFPTSPKSLFLIEQILNEWLKPNITGEKFDMDNIGLLIESKYFLKTNKMISKIFICNDLTSNVLNEAIELNVNLIISYHSPIFEKFNPNTTSKLNDFSKAGDEIATRCYNHDICLYCPHTTLDSIPGGINDAFIWELGGYESELTAVNPINLNKFPLTGVRLEQCTIEDARNISEQFISHQDGGALVSFEVPGMVTASIFDDQSPEEFILNSKKYGYDQINMRIYSNNDFEDINHEIKIISEKILLSKILPYAPGSGRIINFEEPMTFQKLVERTKEILNLKYVQVFFNGKDEIYSVAFAGDSGSYFIKDAPVDVIITGEMSHTNILETIENNKSLIICGHTEIERPYLPKLAFILKIIINCPSVIISKEDTSPLCIM